MRYFCPIHFRSEFMFRKEGEILHLFVVPFWEKLDFCNSSLVYCSLYGMRENPFNFDQCAEIIWPHCKCASDLMDVIGVSSPLLSVNFMQRKNPGIFLTCFAKRPKIDDIPRDKLFIIIVWPARFHVKIKKNFSKNALGIIWRFFLIKTIINIFFSST